MSKRPQHVPWQPVASLFRAWLPAVEPGDEEQADRAETPPVTSLAESVYPRRRERVAAR